MAPNTFVYGHDKTIHQTTELDVETYNGKVVAVWFRCMMLPFNQEDVDKSRAKEMIEAYKEPAPRLLAVEVETNE